MSEYSTNRQQLIDNMNNEQGFISCQYCNVSNAFQFHCHHIIFKSEKPKHEFINHPVNLIILCSNCHEDFHNDKSIRNDIVEARRLDEIFGNDVKNK